MSLCNVLTQVQHPNRIELRWPEEELAMTKSTLELMHAHTPYTRCFAKLGAMSDEEKRQRLHQDIRRHTRCDACRGTRMGGQAFK